MKKEPAKDLSTLPIDLLAADHFMPAPEQEHRFVAIYQGTPTNALSKVGRLDKKKPEVNLNDRAVISEDRLTLFIDRYSELTSTLKSSTVKLLQAGVLQLTYNNSYRQTTPETVRSVAEFTLDEYMALRGLKDRKEARKQIQSDLEVLFNLSIGWMENTGAGEKAFDMMRVCYRTSLSRGGTITMAFSPELANYLVNAYEMKLPELYWRLSDKRNPNSSPLLWKISLLKKQNRGHASEDVISIRTLLENAPDIPSFDEVQASDRAFTRRIIDPLERDLNALSSVLSWEYCNAKRTPLTKKQLERFSYAMFIECYIRIQWTRYPMLESAPSKRQATPKKGQKTPKGG